MPFDFNKLMRSLMATNAWSLMTHSKFKSRLRKRDILAGWDHWHVGGWVILKRRNINGIMLTLMDAFQNRVHVEASSS